MYHDSNTLMMAMKIERSLNEDKLEKARICKDCLSPGVRKFGIQFRFPRIRSGMQKMISGLVETA